MTKKRKASLQQADEKREELQDSDTSDDNLQEQDIVNVDFEFFDPKEDDFHGVKALLRLYLDDTAWDIGGFVEIILRQSTVGTVIKTGEDESLLGVITVLNLGRHKDQNSIKSIASFLKSNCDAAPDVKKLEEIFDKRPNEVGLVVSERLINIPEELAPPLYKGLLDEISWATEDEPTKALRDSFKFKQYLILGRVFHQLPNTKKGSKASKMDKKGRKKGAGSSMQPSSELLIYPKPEVEVLLELSDWSCKFPARSEAFAAHESQGLKQFRLVMLLSVDKMKLFKSKFCAVEQ